MAANARDALLEGVTDALGFVLGALAGWWLGQAFGFDFIRTPGYGTAALAGLVFILLGCGAGRWLSRRVLARLKSHPT
jgi:hypothetical protein